MCNESTKCKLFEQEVFLFIDKLLPEDKMQFWQKEIESSEKIQKIYIETYNTLFAYKMQINEFNLSESIFAEALGKAVSNKSKITSIIKMFGKIKFRLLKSNPAIKFAFALVIIISLSLPIIFNKDKVNIDKSGANNLDWEGKEISSKISEMNEILSIPDKQLQKDKLEYKLASDQWFEEVEKINKKINDLLDEVKNKQF